MAEQLFRGGEEDERLRAITRASSDGSAEAINLLVQVQDVTLRADPRSMIELARGLAPFVDQDAARSKLLLMVSVTAGFGGRRGDDPTADSDPAARLELSRNIAALAIASSGDAKAIDELIKAARMSSSPMGQLAAANALAACGISPWTAKLDPPASATVARLYADSGDLRLLEPLRMATKPAVDPATRAAALIGLAQAGDQRAIDVARTMFGESNPQLRIAAAEALVLLDAPELMRMTATQALLADPSTAMVGVKLAERAQDVSVVRALLTRMAAFGDPTTRENVIVALGHGRTPDALKALVALLPDARLGPAAAQAIARSPNAGAMNAIEKITDKRLAVRAYVLRRTLRGETSDSLDALVLALSRSKDPRDRAVAFLAMVAFDPSLVDAGLADADPRVRRMAAMGARAHESAETNRKLLVALAKEKDEATRVALSGALTTGDPDALVTTLVLVDRAESGGPDAPLAALAIAARARLEDTLLRDKVTALLSSRDPTMRAHVARGLAMSSAADATGVIADAFRYETDPGVRRAMTLAVAVREFDANSPSRNWLLQTAARLDPDATVRLIAKRALANLPPNPAAVVHEVAWVRVVAAADSTIPKDLEASYISADGVTVPIVFDDDGFSIVLGVAPGEGRLMLAPRVP